MTKKALEQEVSTEPVVFEFDGVEYTVPHPRKWPLAITRAQESGKLLGAVEKLLGKKQFAQFDPDEDRTMGDLDDLMVKMFEAVDIDPKD